MGTNRTTCGFYCVATVLGLAGCAAGEATPPGLTSFGTGDASATTPQDDDGGSLDTTDSIDSATSDPTDASATSGMTDPTGATDPTDPTGAMDSSGGGGEQVCGNAMVEGTEACDDGGESATCNADCTVAACGDAVVNAAAGEACDDGGESAACNVDCTTASCGDGVPNATAGEVCDDGGESAACNVDCTAAACGDGVLNMAAGESCDDGGLGDCTPTCSPCSLFEEDFSDNTAGWTLGVEWQIASATVSAGHTVSCGNGDPGTDHSPTADNGVAGVVIGGNAQPVVHGYYYLTSPVIDASGMSTLTLDLWRWLNSDYTRYMQNQIQVYDGVSWQTVWESGASPGVQDAVWTNVVHDITAYINANLQVRIGFQIGSTGVFTCSGWNVDDLVLRDSSC